MKKYKPKHIFVHERLFNVDIVLILCESKDFFEEACKALPPVKQNILKKMLDKRGDNPWCLATQFPFGGGGSIIWARPDAKVSTLVHEIVHVAHHLLDSRDIPLSSDTEEVYAYLIEFLFNNLVVPTSLIKN